MRTVALGLLCGFVGCGSPAKPYTQLSPTVARRESSELVCPDPNQRRETTPNAALPLDRGGYRLVDDQTAISTFINEVASFHGDTKEQVDALQGSSHRSEALMAALLDLTPALHACIDKADKVVPNLQYTLEIKTFGKAVVGSYVTEVSFHRIDSTKDVTTNAEACVADLIGRLELPPSLGHAEMMTVVRYDECAPKAFIAKADVQRYATKAYTTWTVSHPDKRCPDRIDDLTGEAGAKDPWGRAYQLVCGAELPQGTPVGVMSVGRDGVKGTDDDIESWNTLSITRGDSTR